MTEKIVPTEAGYRPTLAPILKIDLALGSADSFDELGYTHAITNELSLWRSSDLIYLRSQNLSVLAHEDIVRRVMGTILEQRDKHTKAAIKQNRQPSPFDVIEVWDDFKKNIKN